MVEVRVKVDASECNALADRIERMANYIENAPVGDPVAEMAREAGEISAEESISLSVERMDGKYVVCARPIGSLADILAAYESMA